MMVFDQPERCANFIKSRLDNPVSWAEPYQAFGMEENGEIVAAVLYNYMTDWDCAIHFAASSPKFLQGPFIHAVFAYPFLQMELRRVTSYTWATNLDALRLVAAFGFKYEGKLRNAGGTESDPVDVVVLGLLKEECRYGRKIRR